MELLHAKQARLLSMKKDAEERLAAVMIEKESLNTTTPSQKEEEIEEEASVNIEELDIIQQLDEMKEKRAQIEKLLFQIQSMKSIISQ